jgi:hypothetical protein
MSEVGLDLAQSCITIQFGCHDLVLASDHEPDGRSRLLVQSIHSPSMTAPDSSDFRRDFRSQSKRSGETTEPPPQLLASACADALSEKNARSTE